MRFAAFLALVGLVAGCGTPEGQLPTYRTTGKVLLRGKPAVGAYVVFHPQFEYDHDADPPSGVVREDGTYSLSTYGEDDGAPAGPYKVAVLPPTDFTEGVTLQRKQEKGTDPAFEKASKPEESGFTFTVQKGRNVVPDFELK